MAHGIATQFFGCLVNASDFADLWVVKALARYVTGLYIERTFGLSEYIYQINHLMEVICNYEDTFGQIVLRHRDSSTHADLHFDPTCPYTCSPNYAEMLYKKGQLIMRILEIRLGKDQFIKVLQRIVVIALEYGGHFDKPVDWYHTVVSIDSFFNTVTSVTGRELPSFIDLFINSGGHNQFDVQYTPNRKRNTIEIEIRQDIKGKKGCNLYQGPLTINVQACFVKLIIFKL
jgi:aminopeptidase N